MCCTVVTCSHFDSNKCTSPPRLNSTEASVRPNLSPSARRIGTEEWAIFLEAQSDSLTAVKVEHYSALEENDESAAKAKFAESAFATLPLTICPHLTKFSIAECFVADALHGFPLHSLMIRPQLQTVSIPGQIVMHRQRGELDFCSWKALSVMGGLVQLMTPHIQSFKLTVLPGESCTNPEVAAVLVQVLRCNPVVDFSLHIKNAIDLDVIAYRIGDCLPSSLKMLSLCSAQGVEDTYLMDLLADSSTVHLRKLDLAVVDIDDTKVALQNLIEKQHSIRKLELYVEDDTDWKPEMFSRIRLKTFIGKISYFVMTKCYRLQAE